MIHYKRKALQEMNQPRLCLIAALSRNRVIGRNGQLPWRISADLRHFKALTLGKPVIMGRKTFESIGKPLPERCNIVITRNPAWRHPGAVVAPSLAEALTLARQRALEDGVDEIMVIGGGQVYEAALALADRLYLTEIDAEVDGDAVFPQVSAEQWRESARQFANDDSSADNPWRYAFVTYVRV